MPENHVDLQGTHQTFIPLVFASPLSASHIKPLSISVAIWPPSSCHVSQRTTNLTRNQISTQLTLTFCLLLRVPSCSIMVSELHLIFQHPDDSFYPNDFFPLLPLPSCLLSQICFLVFKRDLVQLDFAFFADLG